MLLLTLLCAAVLCVCRCVLVAVDAVVCVIVAPVWFSSLLMSVGWLGGWLK